MNKKLVLLIVSGIVVSGCQMTSTSMANHEHMDTHYQIAKKAYQQGDLHVAEGYLHRVTAVEPNHAPSWCLLGHIGFRLNRYEAAQQGYERCLRIHPQQPLIWHNLAALRLRQATELLMTGLPYLTQETAPLVPHFKQNYQLLLNELKYLHGLTLEPTEVTADAH